MSPILLILGLFMFTGLVVVHEWGHFIVARRNGVDVEEFGIGFPPRLWKKKIKSPKGDYNFTLNLLPLGGFVKLKGEHDADTEPGSFGAAGFGAKCRIMLAGVAMNLLTAFVLMTILALAGMPKLLNNQFTVSNDTKTVKNEVLAAYVEPGSPAENAGLKVQDKLVSVDDDGQVIWIEDAEKVPEMTRSLAGRNVRLNIERSGQPQTLNVTLRSNEEVEASKNTDNPKGYLGMSPTEFELRRSTWSAPVTAAGVIVQLTTETLKGLGNAVANLFTGEFRAAGENVSGPVGIFVILKEGSLLGFQFILMIIAIISLTLAIMNVLPIPALDGGRFFVMAAYKVFDKKLKPETEELINGAGFLLLMALFVVITIVDVGRYF